MYIAGSGDSICVRKVTIIIQCACVYIAGSGDSICVRKVTIIIQFSLLFMTFSLHLAKQ